MGFASHLNIALAGVRWHCSGRRKPGTKLLFPVDLYVFCSLCLHRSAQREGPLPLLGLVEILMPRAPSGTLILDTPQQAYRMCTLLSPCKRLLKWSPLMHGGQWRYLFPPRRHESPGSLLRALWHWFSKHHMVPFLVQTPRSSFTSVKERNHVFFFFFCSVWHD